MDGNSSGESGPWNVYTPPLMQSPVTNDEVCYTPYTTTPVSAAPPEGDLYRSDSWYGSSDNSLLQRFTLGNQSRANGAHVNSLGAYERKRRLKLAEVLGRLLHMARSPKRLALALVFLYVLYTFWSYTLHNWSSTLTSDQVALTAQWFDSREGTVPLVSVSRVFADVNERKPSELWDWENYRPELSTNIDRYEFGAELGSGKYSFVYKAVDLQEHNRTVAIKVFMQDRPTKMRREILILLQLQKNPHTVKFYEGIMDHLGVCGIVMEYIEQPPWKEFYKTFSLGDIKRYGKHLLEAVAAAHEQGIMHRDIKPLNILINNKTKQATLIDWGLADFYHPGKAYPLRVATKMFKPPELLLGMSQYDYSLDMWMIGVHLAGQLFKVNYFFNGESDEQQLQLYVSKFGSEPFVQYAKKYQLDKFPEPNASLLDQYKGKVVPPTSWTSFVTPKNRHLIQPESLDLLNKLLVVDHAHRLTAKQALAHDFFKDVN